jgi:hypothetical protein
LEQGILNKLPVEQKDTEKELIHSLSERVQIDFQPVFLNFRIGFDAFFLYADITAIPYKLCRFSIRFCTGLWSMIEEVFLRAKIVVQ